MEAIQLKTHETYSYNGYTIRKNTDPWQLKYKQNFTFWKGDVNNIDMDNTHDAETIADVISEIAELEDLYHEVKVSRDIEPKVFTSIMEAIGFARFWNVPAPLTNQFENI